MRTKFIVVDQFYQNPDAVRALALSSEYVSGAKFNYPGYQSSKRFDSDALKQAFEKVIGAPIAVDYDAFTFGGFRIVTEETGKMTKVHADTVIDWAGMIFLTPDAPTAKGIGFFRHKETGLEGPPTDKQAREMGYEDASEFDLRVARKDQADMSKWELVMQVPPVYNRLILFRGADLYHAAIGGFGDNPQNARLTHNFFFDEATRF